MSNVPKQKFKVGDLIKIVEDPNSFFIGDLLANRMGIVIEYDKDKKIYLILLESGKKMRVLEFMLKKIRTSRKKSAKVDSG